jgi:hypothetical protein
MLNKKSAFGLIAAAALVSFPIAVSAQQTEVNSQSAGNSGVASGVGNVVGQDADQNNLQQQQSVDPTQYGVGTDPQLQINQQKGTNSGAAIGEGNAVIQDVDQNSLQQQYGVGK